MFLSPAWRTGYNEERSSPIHIVPGLLAVSLFVMVSAAGLLLVQRSVSTQTRQQHNDVAGFIYAVLGVAYAVLLGLMLIAVWEEWEVAKDIVGEEANDLADIFSIAQGLPPREGERIQELIRSYTRVVVEDEWALMAQGEASPRAWDLLEEIRSSIGEFNPTTSAQQVLYEQALERVHELADARRDRLLEAEEGIPAILWAVLLVGGVIVVGFTYLFGLENTLVHTLMVAALALVIGLILFTVGVLNHPFKGDVHVGPEAFELELERFQESNLSDP